MDMEEAERVELSTTELQEGLWVNMAQARCADSLETPSR